MIYGTKATKKSEMVNRGSDFGVVNCNWRGGGSALE